MHHMLYAAFVQMNNFPNVFAATFANLNKTYRQLLDALSKPFFQTVKNNRRNVKYCLFFLVTKSKDRK